MGNSAKKCQKDQKDRPKCKKVVLLGLHGAGRTTLLHRLKHGEDATQPYCFIGDNFEKLQGQHLQFCFWDIGVRSRLRPMYRSRLRGAEAVVFVIDSSDTSTDNVRWDEIRDIIQEMLSNENYEKLPLLILANKQDLPGCMTPEEVTKALSLDMEKCKGPIAVLPTSATTGEGLEEAFHWVEEAISSQSPSDCAGGDVETKAEIPAQKVSKRTHGNLIGSVVAYAKSLLWARSQGA